VIAAFIDARTADRSKLPADVTGTVAAFRFSNVMIGARLLVPNLKRLAVVGDPFERQPFRSQYTQEIQQFSKEVEIIDLSGMAMSEIRKRASTLPDDAAILFTSIYRDVQGTVPYAPAEPVALVAEVANRPIVADNEVLIGLGATGGVVARYDPIARETARLTQRVLNGEKAGDIPFTVGDFAHPTFDWRQLQRFGISDSRLPSGSEVRFRSFGLWEQYRWYIVGAISLIVLQTLFIVGFLVQRARRQAAEIGIRAKESELRVSYQQVSQLAGRLICAQEEERTRIARELHDDVGQRVASLSIGLSGLKRRVPNSDASARNELSGLQQQTMGLAKDLRDLSHDLHPGALGHVGLVEALRGRCEEINGESDTRVEVEVAEGWSDVPADVELCLYRVAQEALRNITKHAHAKTARIALARQNGPVEMRIADDGRGMPANGSNGQHGIGLLSMRERVRMLGGSFEMESSSAGTVATVIIPVGETL
jgi:signal transduction histidine kinase